MNSLIYNSLVIVSILSVLIPLFFSIIKHRTFNKQLNVLFIYLSISFAIEIASVIIALHPIIYFAFTLLEYLLISYIFLLEFEKKSFKIIICILSALFLCITLSVFIYNKDLWQTDDISSTVEAIIIIGLGILYFFKIFSDLSIPKLTSYYYFWLNSAFLLYFSTALFLFLFKSFIKTTDPVIGHFLWGIHLIINITYNILLTIGICKHRKT